MRRKANVLIHNKSLGRMQALAAVNAGFNLTQGTDAVNAGQSNSQRSADSNLTIQGNNIQDVGVTASASAGQGQGAGNSTTFTNSQVAGSTVNIESGGDTTLQGAVVQGNQVTATVGGNLNIQSLQDTNQYKESSKSAGGSVTVGSVSAWVRLPWLSCFCQTE